jgi:integrase
MARTTGRLTALKVRQAKRPGMYPDGAGLYLQVTAGGASWILRYMLAGRAREMGLGPLALFGLSEARAKALDARRLRHEGIDPIEVRHAERARVQLDAARSVTFAECAQAYVETHRAGWRNKKHQQQWTNTLKDYAAPVIGALPVQAVDTALVLKVLEPIWTAIPETAARLRGRIEVVLDWATGREYRQGENPARWRGHLDKLLPARGKVRKVAHHAALPWGDLPGFMESLRGQGGIAARALEFSILTAARTGETLFARWGELNLLDKTWTVPAERMKAGKEHRVPLSPRALAILKEMQRHQQTRESFVFPGPRTGRAIADRSMRQMLARIGRGDITVHGFRSSFRDWAAERTSFANHVVEAALAHAIGDKVEAAYRRGDLFEKRSRLMEAWAEFCAKPAQAGNVTSIRQAI